MLFGIQFLNDFAAASSKERQFGEELYSSEVKHRRYAFCFSPFYKKIKVHYWGKHRAYWGKCSGSYIVKNCPEPICI
jgi:hypothetical protein